MILRPADRIRVGTGVSAREFDGEWIVLDLAGGNYFGLDEVGGAIWHGLSEEKSLEEIARDLAKKYEASESAILSDVVTFVGELLRRRLVEVRR